MGHRRLTATSPEILMTTGDRRHGPAAGYRHRGRSVVTGTVVLLFVLALAETLVGCAGPRHMGTPTGSGPGATQAAPTPTATPFSGDLRTLLLEAPSTSRPYLKPHSPDGTLTAASVAAEYTYQADVLSFLNQLSFQAGAIIQWHDADDSQVEIRIYQFGSAANAAKYAAWLRRGYETDPGYRDGSVVRGIDDSLVFVAKAADDYNLAEAEVIFARGYICVKLSTYQQTRVDLTMAETLATQQYAALP
jgi:hypothetical protein